MQINNAITVDLETSIKNRGEDAIGTNEASPFHPDNKIVCIGLKSLVGSTSVFPSKLITNIVTPRSDAPLLVGHNFKFDLLYLRKEFPEWWERWKKEGMVWDTQLAEFIITGQEFPFPSLNSLSEKYGGTLKDDKIKEYWNNGIDTEDIPKEELYAYQKEDVVNTELVFRNQIAIAKEEGLLNLIRTQMDALLAICEMEWNGMYADRETLRHEASLVSLDLLRVESRIRTYVHELATNPSLFDINSNQHWSVVLFGGTVQVTTKELMLDENGNKVKFKSGKRKGMERYKNVKKPFSMGGTYPPRTEWETKTKGIYKTNDDVLADLPPSRIKDYLVKYRKLIKDLSTYYEGYGKLIWPDSCIHPNYNHCVARTGRLSCSQPNLQNASGED